MRNVKVINLIDGVVRSVDSKTFNIPPRKDRSCLRRGNWAKICDNLDRFWVSVETIITNEDGIVYVGRIDNHLVSGQTDYGFGDLVYFTPNNVIDIINKTLWN